MNKIKVYIASKYSFPEGQQLQNTYNSFAIYHQLVNLGFIPFAPLHSHFIHEKFPLPYEKWIMIDLEWLKICNCVLRLDGESQGSDIECQFAKENNIPVFYDIDGLITYYKKD